MTSKLAWIVAFSLLQTACALSGSGGTSRIVISMPDSPATVAGRKMAASQRNGNGSGGGGGGSSFSNPTSLADFSCIGVMVSGDGIAPFGAANLKCVANPTVMPRGLGKLAGLVPASGGVVDIQVPSGKSRLIQLIGVQSVGGCPDLIAAVNSGANQSFNIGQPYQIASVQQDIFGDQSIEMKESFNPLTAQPMFNCDGGGGNNGAPPVLGAIDFYPHLVTSGGNIRVIGSYLNGTSGNANLYFDSACTQPVSGASNYSFNYAGNNMFVISAMNVPLVARTFYLQASNNGSSTPCTAVTGSSGLGYQYTGSASAISISSPYPGQVIDGPTSSAGLTISGSCGSGTAVYVYFNNIQVQSCSCAGTFSCSPTGNMSALAGQPDGLLNLRVSVTGTPPTSDDGYVMLKDSLAPGIQITVPSQNALLTTANMSSYTMSGTCGASGYPVTISYYSNNPGSNNSGPATVLSSSVPCSASVWTYIANFTGAPEGNLSINASIVGPNGAQHTSYAAVSMVKNSSFLFPSLALGQADLIANTATTTGTGLSGPRDTASAGTKFLAVDSVNNRVLIWNTIPTATGQTASVVLGQSTLTVGSGGTGTTGMSQPYSVATDGTNVAVADYANNRVQVWNSAFPSTNLAAPNVYLGQSTGTGVTFNGMGTFGTSGAQDLWYPTSVAIAGTKLIVGDSGNYRVLIYNMISTLTNGIAANTVIGQPNMTTSNFPASCAAGGINYPRVATNGTSLAVSDENNHRILFYNTIPSTNGVAPDFVLGQPNTTSCSSNQGIGTGPSTLNTPGGVAFAGTRLYVADALNNRVLYWNNPTTTGQPADGVIGQGSLMMNNAAAGLGNLSSPRSVTVVGSSVYVSDTGNNRVLQYTAP